MSTLKNTSILCSALTCVLPAAEVAGATPNEQRPNIIFILADDLGYMDVCSFAHRVTGTPIDSMFFETPHIDRLVEEGMAPTAAAKQAAAKSPFTKSQVYRQLLEE